MCFDILLFLVSTYYLKTHWHLGYEKFSTYLNDEIPPPSQPTRPPVLARPPARLPGKPVPRRLLNWFIAQGRDLACPKAKGKDHRNGECRGCENSTGMPTLAKTTLNVPYGLTTEMGECGGWENSTGKKMLLNWFIALGGGRDLDNPGTTKVCLALHQEMELLGCYINFNINQIFW